MIFKFYRPIIMVMVILILSTMNVYAATITVDSTADVALPNVDGNCTLREAIEAAETNATVDMCAAGSGADTIVFAASIVPGSILIEADDLSNSANPITESLTIQGPGVEDITIDGDDTYGFFDLNSPTNDQHFSFSGLTLFQASGGSGPAIDINDGETVVVSDVVFDSNTSSSSGGAITLTASISSDPTLLEIYRSQFTNNRSQSSTGGGAIRFGSANTVKIEDSTFRSNQAQGSAGNGGAILGIGSSSSGILEITRSTFSGNKAKSSGGAIFVSTDVSVTISHSTITQNEADEDLNDSGNGGGIALAVATSSLTLSNSIVAANIDSSPTITGRHDISLGVASLVTNGFNFIGKSFGSGFSSGFPNSNNDYVGTSAIPIDPGLDALADNGGLAKTHLPKVGSDVIDNGNCIDEETDQRGFISPTSPILTRIVDDSGVTNGSGSDGCDIGAVEVGAVPVLDVRYDMNNDGMADLLWRNEFTGRNTVWFMDGSDRTALGLPVVGTTAWQVKGFGDTDGDGRTDILWRNMTDGRNQIWKMIDGGKQTGSIATISDLNWELVGADDFDGNGTDDILWRHALDGRNTIYFMDGFNATSTSITSISNLDWQVAGTGDIDGDDKADIFWRNQVTGQNTVWLMDGANNSSNNLTSIPDTNWTVQGIGDLNKDGLDDIVWRDAVTRSVTAWLMGSGLTEDQQTISASSGSNFEIELVGDLSGDGKADIVWRDQVNGTNLLWEMDGVIKTPSSIQKVGDTNWEIMP